MQPSYSQRSIDILRLARTENVSPRLFFRLLELFPNPSDAFEHITELSVRGGRRAPLKVCSLEQAEKELSAVEGFGARIITFEDSIYPKLLLHVEDSPPVLTCKGNLDLFSKDPIAIVGARSASINGKSLAKSIARNICARSNVAIVSGLAKGIDTAAHEGAFPNTIAVLAGGIDSIYPQENSALYHRISEQGILVAELPIFAKPLVQNFPQRNRIISGLSLGVVIVEAGNNSGSLITARYALEQGREVFAVPGFPLDPRSRGANKLIKEGALIVEDAQDIISDLPFLNKIRDKLQEKGQKPCLQPVLDFSSQLGEDARQTILDLLSHSPVSLELLLQAAQMPIPAIYQILLELELAGRIVRHPGNFVARILESDL